MERFSKNTKISNFVKICPEGADLFHADGGTDRHDEAFRNFANPRKNIYELAKYQSALSR